MADHDQIEAEAQAEFDRLVPHQQGIVRRAMRNHPALTLATTLEMLNAFG